MIGSDSALASIALREGGVHDLDDVVSIMNLAFDPAFGEAWTRAQCAGILPMPGVALTIAEDEPLRPLGFSLYRTIAGEAELLLLAVSPEKRGQGIGRLLLDRFVSDVGKMGARKVHLEVRDNNPALALYQAAGFRMVGCRRDYYSGLNGARFDALTFVKQLDAPETDTL